MEKPEWARERFRALGSRAGEMIQTARAWTEPSDRAEALRRGERAQLEANDTLSEAYSDYFRAIRLTDAGCHFLKAGKADRAHQPLKEAVEYLTDQYRMKGFETLHADLERAMAARYQGLVMEQKTSEALDLLVSAEQEFGIDVKSVGDDGAL